MAETSSEDRLEKLLTDLERLKTRLTRKKATKGLQSNEVTIAKRQVASAELRLSTMLRQGRDDSSREVKKLKLELEGLAKQKEALESRIVYWQNLADNYDETIASARKDLQRKKEYSETLENPKETADDIRQNAMQLLQALVAADNDIKGV